MYWITEASFVIFMSFESIWTWFIFWISCWFTFIENPGGHLPVIESWFYISFILGEIGSYYQVWLVVVVLVVDFSVILAVLEQAELL